LYTKLVQKLTYNTNFLTTQKLKTEKKISTIIVESINLFTAERRREREFIFHVATTLEQAHNRNTKLGGLPERHLAHQSWPPIATIYCKYTVTTLYRRNVHGRMLTRRFLNLFTGRLALTNFIGFTFMLANLCNKLRH